MHKQITIIGPIGSGKTTASQFLSHALALPLLDVDLYETNPFLEGYIQDTPRWAFTTELFFTMARIDKLKQIKTMLKKSSVIVDSGLIMSHYVYTKNHLVQGTMTASEWEFFTRIIQSYQSYLPAPDIVIYLTCSPLVQLARIKARGRSFEAGYTLDYLQSITDRLGEYAESLANDPSTILLTFDSEKYDITKDRGQKELLSLITKNGSL
ncbi:MAG: deoxynucleoside kinase [Microgenomates group bacterium]